MNEFFDTKKHLLYSSPAAISFHSPGAEGFGVKRAALSIPDSILLLVSPGCCGRNTSGIGDLPEYKNRFFFLTMDQADIVTGRHLKKIPEAVERIIFEYERRMQKKPSVVMICITCVDALLGTDMERVCKKAEAQVHLPVRPCYMYALTREGRRPPMVHIRQSLYSLLEKREKRSTSINLLGYFAPLTDDCELYDIFHQMGIRQIREISRCRDYSEFQLMAEANFNVILHAEARPAAADLEKRLGIPYIELRRLYQMDKVERQYLALGQALNATIDIEEAKRSARSAMEAFKQALSFTPSFAVGEFMNGDPFELALSLLREGFRVSEIFGTISEESSIYIEKISVLSPDTKIYSNLDPGIIHYEETAIDFTIGKDAAYYHPGAMHLLWNEDIQPFGFAGIRGLYTKLLEVYQGTQDSPTVSGICGAVPADPGVSGSFDPETNVKPIRGLRCFLPPFAPDASGAASVFYSLGGMTVICDAGGCTGNICGFDEPRWLSEKSAVYSAGLRDMDAILGRDDRLVEKLEDAVKRVDPSNIQFVAFIGTPVSSVIGTDYRALGRMAQRQTGIQTLSIDTSGMELYDTGVSKAYLELFRTFAEETSPATSQIGILGATPLDTGMLSAKDFFKEALSVAGEGPDLCCFGMEDGLDCVRHAPGLAKNIVIAPAGLGAAEYLFKRFQIPYEIAFPGAKELLAQATDAYFSGQDAGQKDSFFSGRQVLVIHQHVLAHEIAELIQFGHAGTVQTASWFQLIPQFGGTRLRDEEDLVRLIREFQPDIIVTDKIIRPLIREAGSDAILIDLPHFAVSGRLFRESDRTNFK